MMSRIAAAVMLIGVPALAQDHPAGHVETTPGSLEHFDTTYDVEFGRMWVPMNRRNPDSPTLQLHFVRYKSNSPNPGPPAVYLAGGPGGSGISAMRSSRARTFLALLDERDFIAFDQRGTGQSQPQRLRVDRRVKLPLDKPPDLDEYCTIAQDIARDTLALLEEHNVDPWAFTTEQSADDLNDLRIAVGADKLILWGSSYGTHLALATVRRHPDAVAAIILAGTEGPDHTFKLPSNIDANFAALGELVAADTVYGELLPDLVGTTRKLMEDLQRNPRTLTLIPGFDVTMTRWDLQKVMSQAMGSRGSMQEFPAVIYAMSQGEYFKLATAVVGLRRVSGRSAMSMVMDCASWSTAERLRRIKREDRTSLMGATIDFPFPCVCEVEGMPRLGDDFRAPVHSKIPALFISGTIDGRTPISNAAEIAEGFPNSQHLVITGASHGGDLFTSSPKIVEFVKLFLRGETLPESVIEGPSWEFEPPYVKSIEHELLTVLTTEGYEAAEKRLRSILDEPKDKRLYDLREVVLNALGYAVMRGSVTDVDLALNVFRLNTVAYPESFNTWDSLAEGYMEKGDNLNAVKYYRKSLELNPDNTGATRMIQRMAGEQE